MPGGRCGSAANAWHAEHGAAFGEKSGWERVNWYESNAADGDESLRPRGWAGQHWSPAIGAEHRAAREARRRSSTRRSFAKLEIAGPGAAELLERLCDNQVAREVGRITYTQMLNSRGGIECDFTVARLAEERFSIVTGTAFGNHDREWIRKHLPDGRRRSRSATSPRPGRASGSGARGRATCSPPLTPQDLSQRGLSLHDGCARSRSATSRCGRCGSPTSASSAGSSTARPSTGSASGGALWEAGEQHGMVAAGYRAIDSLRLEKGYRVWGADITPDETPVRGRCSASASSSTSRAASSAARRWRRRRSAGPRTRLCCLTLADPRSVALGNEPVRVDGEIAGRVTTGGYGYTVERSIAYAYLPPERAEPGTAVEVEIFGEWVAGEVAAEPLFDPEGERIRA